MAVMMDAEQGAGGSSVPVTTTTTSGKVDSALVEKAVDALLKWNAAQKKVEKSQLLEDEQLMYVVVGMNKMPVKGRTNPCSVPLPHPLYNENHEVCLIISDRLNAKLDKKIAKERIEKEGLKIAKVIPLSKLKTDYFSFEMKRKLCGSYDIFLADDRILQELPKLLGKTFYKKKKHPIPVTLTRAQWKGQVTAALNSAFVYLSGGTCSVVKVARVSQSREEIVENVKAVLDGVVEQIPQKWANIRAFFLKLLESTALPLYQAIPVMPLKIDLTGLSQQGDEKGSEKRTKKDKKKSEKASLAKGKKEKVSSENEEDKMDVVEDPVVAKNPKKVVEKPAVAEKLKKTVVEVSAVAEKSKKTVVEVSAVAEKSKKTVVEEPVVAEKSKKRKQNVVEVKRTVPKRGKVVSVA